MIGGAGYESEAQLAFAGLHQLFLPVLGYLDRVEDFHRDVLRRVMGFADGPAPDRLAVCAATVAVHDADVAQPTTLSPQDVLDAERLGLVTRDSTSAGLRFRHPLVRSAIVNTAAPDDVRATHAQLAELYRNQSERRLWHLAAATVAPDEQVAAEIEASAKAVSARGGTGLAVAALRRASELSPAVADAARRLHDAAELASEAGQLDLAQRLIGQAQRHRNDPAQVVRAQTTTAQVLLRRDGDLAAARRLLSHAIGDDAQEDDAQEPVPDPAFQLMTLVAFYAADEADWRHLAELRTRRGSELGELSQPYRCRYRYRYRCRTHTR